MISPSRQTIIRRLLYLRNWEFFNIFWLPICLFVALTARNILDWQPYAFGMLLTCAILAQGVLYWHLKLQTIYKTGTTFPGYFSDLFSFFNWANVILLFSYPALIFCDQITPLVNFRASIGSNLIFLLAVLEYINYFHYQLSHDNLNDLRYLFKFRKIRRSPLFMDLLRNQKGNRKP